MVVPVIVDLAEVRHQLVTVTSTANGLDASTGTGPHIVDCFQGIVHTTSGKVDAIVLMSLQSEQDIEVVVLGDIKIILSSVRPCPLCAVGLSQFTGIGVIVDNVRVPGVSQCADVTIGIVDTEVRTDQQSFDGGDVGIGVGKDAPFLQTVVLVMIELAHWVLAVRHTTYRTGECLAVNLVNGQRGRHFQGVLQRCTIYIIRIREGSILTNRHNLVDFVTAVETS